eukprot:1031749-Rhodomonas_salina.5
MSEQDAFGDFSLYTDENIETLDVLNVKDCEYVFVNMKHPVIHMIRFACMKCGSEMFEGNFDGIKQMNEIKEMEMNEKTWLKVEKSLFECLCNTFLAVRLG